MSGHDLKTPEIDCISTGVRYLRVTMR